MSRESIDLLMHCYCYFSACIIGVNDYCASRPLNLPIDCVKALQAGQDLVAKENILGSATICLVSLNSKTRVLQAANIGDSGFIVIRLEKNPETSVLEPSIVFRSPPQEHVFGCPFQLGIGLFQTFLLPCGCVLYVCSWRVYLSSFAV